MIRILKSGLLDTIQDLGRIGYQKYGVIVSGAMDSFSHRLANVLVGNLEKEAALEMTLSGPEMLFETDALIAICGGHLSPVINGESVPMWRPVLIKKGTKLQFGYAQKGCRAYLAVAGGFDVPPVMGSKSTYLRASLGGYQGRSLQTNDTLLFGKPSEASEKLIAGLSAGHNDRSFITGSWCIAEDMYLYRKHPAAIRVLKGAQFDWFDNNSQLEFYQKEFKVSSQSDRMGYRLEGPSLALEQSKDMISDAINFGSIQVPPDGRPIVLMADRQSVGGYPKIGQIASVDLPSVAQTKPGEIISFTEITTEKAQALYIEREKLIAQVKLGISLKLNREDK
ncbi:5-oxoprolinase subunit C family protein [Bacillus norwichensis]|uniref:Biotin-dependent carboxyltransferase family protein n=1 Tax=Bacillus norwichensis TaxID=2762217 RepID=A0ABR8VHV0_9BACI|nr:biotin-dependent carboxyltransferase family protein [Bacillus norwichensis]MBD8004335.1 biotin-dependent carboxyltransferase family protein [Bacillus norwichensis]